MIKCLAIDDESLALDLLEDNISKIPFLELIGKCKNAFDAIDFLQNYDVDLIFLDIQMPGISGIQMLQSLKQAPLVIFITAYENFALEGFNLNAIDYLLKPVSFERFLKAANKANDYLLLHNRNHEIHEEKSDFFFVNADYNLLKISLSEILYIEGLKDYIKIHCKNFERPVITRLSMKSMEERLPSRLFLRVHKSFIVSVENIHSIRKNRIRIGQEEIPVSDFYKENLVKLTGDKHL